MHEGIRICAPAGTLSKPLSGVTRTLNPSTLNQLVGGIAPVEAMRLYVRALEDTFGLRIVNPGHVSFQSVLVSCN